MCSSKTFRPGVVIIVKASFWNEGVGWNSRTALQLCKTWRVFERFGGRHVLEDLQSVGVFVRPPQDPLLGGLQREALAPGCRRLEPTGLPADDDARGSLVCSNLWLHALQVVSLVEEDVCDARRSRPVRVHAAGIPSLEVGNAVQRLLREDHPQLRVGQELHALLGGSVNVEGQEPCRRKLSDLFF